MPDREQEIRARAEAATPDLDALTPQQCTAGKHADWAVDSEHAHACPWCEIDRLREEAHLFTVAMAQRDAYAAAAARRALEGIASEWAAHCPDHSTSAEVSMFCRCDDANELRMRAEGVREDAVASPARAQGEEAAR